jgi:transposase-like protein
MNEGMTMPVRAYRIGQCKPRHAESFRRMVVELVRRGETPYRLSRRFNIAHSTIYHWTTAANVTSAYVKSIPKVPTRRRAVEMAHSGMIAEHIAKDLGVGTNTVSKWLRDAGIVVDRTMSQRMRRNHASSPNGRKRQQQTRDAVRLHVIDGLGSTRIGALIGTAQTNALKLLKTPYAEALMSYVYDVVPNRRTRPAIARDMRRAGYDEACIERTLYMSDERPIEEGV